MSSAYDEPSDYQNIVGNQYDQVEAIRIWILFQI